MFVQAEDVTPSGVQRWGETHAGCGRRCALPDGPWRWSSWAATRSGWRRPSRCSPGWTKAPAAPGAGVQRAAEARAEFAKIQAAVARADLAALEEYGGINGALGRMRDLWAAAAQTDGTAPAITSGRTWRSTRVRP